LSHVSSYHPVGDSKPQSFDTIPKANWNTNVVREIATMHKP